jgi:hypothetical protein
MAPRPPVALAVGALVCAAALTGCGGGADAGPTSTATPAEYIAAVQRLVEPPGQLASSLEERGHAVTGAAPSRRRIDRIVAAARDRLEEFRALRLGDPVLRRQRDRLAGAYARMIPHMRTAADALDSRDRASLSRASRPFLDALDALSSAAAASSPSR